MENILYKFNEKVISLVTKDSVNFFRDFLLLKIFFLAACFSVGFAVLGTGFEGEKSGVVICVIGEGKIANIISL